MSACGGKRHFPAGPPGGLSVALLAIALSLRSLFVLSLHSLFNLSLHFLFILSLHSPLACLPHELLPMMPYTLQSHALSPRQNSRPELSCTVVLTSGNVSVTVSGTAAGSISFDVSVTTAVVVSHVYTCQCMS